MNVRNGKAWRAGDGHGASFQCRRTFRHWLMMSLLTVLVMAMVWGNGGMSAMVAGEVLRESYTVAPGVNLSSYNEAIQRAAYEAVVAGGAQTGILYSANLTGELANVTVQAVRLRVGSLRKRGVSLGRFTVPPGVKVLNFSSLRVILVYRDFGNVTTYTSPVQMEALVSPVVGIKVYNGDILNTTTPLPSLEVTAFGEAIQAAAVPEARAKPVFCVEFNENGTSVISNVTTVGNYSSCAAKSFGDFVLAGQAPPGKKSNAWKIAVGTVVGAVGLIVLVLILAFLVRRRLRRRKIARMQFQVDQGETLRSHLIGNSRAPGASGTRTRPQLEKDYLET